MSEADKVLELYGAVLERLSVGVAQPGAQVAIAAAILTDTIRTGERFAEVYKMLMPAIVKTMRDLK